ncbi:hypothetical protein FRC19_001954 [Serendipita sp. 401]|nr:hypothetical protein FRC19_001954 [Serendipita sp. 401]KAG9045877.1 hypothetical protein FS842_001067 [Serendipita sp. 407]
MSLQFVHSHDALHPHSAAIWALAVTPSADVLTASLDGTLALYTSSVTQSTSGFPKDEDIPSDAQELDAGARIRTWPAHPLAWVSLSVTANPTRSEGSDESDVSRRALVNSIAGTTMLVDYTSGEVLGTKNIGEKQSGPGTSSGYAEPAWSVSLASDGKTYASTGGSGSVTIHSAIPSSSSAKSDSMEEGFGSRLADIPTGRVKFGMFVDHCPTDDNKVAMSNETGQVFILDVEKATVSTSWASHAMPVRSLGWSGDGNLIMSASDDRRLVLHDARVSTTSSSSAVAHLTGHALPVLSVALSPGDGRLALSGSRDGTVRVWDVGMRKSVGVVREGKPVWGVAWRPVGNVSSNMEDGLTSSATGGFGGIGGTGASGFVTGGEEGLVRWYRGAGQV